MTPSGNRLLEVSSNDDRESLNDEWKGIARNISAVDSEARVSHPYQIMLKMLTVRPGTPRSLCALALEALDDSDTELDRIITLRDLNDESQIRASLGISKSNWDNAKKILPSIAEQIGDVARGRDRLYLVTTELTAPTSVRHTGGEIRNSARKVTVDTIATTKTPDDSDEAATINQANLVSLSEAIAKRTERSHRHNRLVQQFSASLLDQSAELWEGTFDCLAIVEEVILLAEMKTLDGSDSDETDQVRAASAQLLYYEAFDVRMVPELADRLLIKIAAFESTPSDPHVLWLESIGVWVVWRLDGGEFAASENSRAALADHLRLQRADNRSCAMATYSGFISAPRKLRSLSRAATHSDPDPTKGTMTRSPGLESIFINFSLMLIGFCVGCATFSPANLLPARVGIFQTSPSNLPSGLGVHSLPFLVTL